MNERRKINELAAESDSEKWQFAEFVNNIVKQRSGASPSQLTIEQQTAAVPTDAIPQVIADKAANTALSSTQHYGPSLTTISGTYF
jgi:hypothetical protein